MILPLWASVLSSVSCSGALTMFWNWPRLCLISWCYWGDEGMRSSLVQAEQLSSICFLALQILNRDFQILKYVYEPKLHPDWIFFRAGACGSSSLRTDVGYISEVTVDVASLSWWALNLSMLCECVPVLYPSSLCALLDSYLLHFHIVQGAFSDPWGHRDPSLLGIHPACCLYLWHSLGVICLNVLLHPPVSVLPSWTFGRVNCGCSINVEWRDHFVWHQILELLGEILYS